MTAVQHLTRPLITIADVTYSGGIINRYQFGDGNFPVQNGQLFAFLAPATNDNGNLGTQIVAAGNYFNLNCNLGEIVEDQPIIVMLMNDGTSSTQVGYVVSNGVTSLERVGTIKLWSGVTTPDGWQPCNGADISRTTYNALFLAITYAISHGSRTSGSPVVTGITEYLDSSLIDAGIDAEVDGFAAGTTIVSVDSSSQLTLSNNASSTLAGLTPGRLFPYGNGDGSSTFTIPNLTNPTASSTLRYIIRA